MSKTKRIIRPERVNSNGEVTIYIKYTHRSKNCYFSTGEQILLKHWTTSGDCVTREHRGYVKLNIYIEEVQVEIDEIRRDLVRSNIDPSAELVKAKFIESKQPKTTTSSDFFSCLDDFIEYKKNVEQIKDSTLKSYRTFDKHLKDFDVYLKRRITFNNINQNWYSNYIDYLYNEVDLGINSCGAQIKNLKVFLNWCVLNNITNNMDFKRFKKPSMETNIVALTQEELSILWKHNFKRKSLETIRDAFVISCVTGLRFSDYSRIRKDNVVGNRIIIHSNKTGEELRIPLNEVGAEILKKYNYEIKVPSNQKINDYLKEAAKIAGLNGIRELKKSNGRKTEIIKKPLHEIISTHIGRKTFITHLLDNGVPIKDVMKLSGHKNLTSFQRYMGISEHRLEEYVNNIWETS